MDYNGCITWYKHCSNALPGYRAGKNPTFIREVALTLIAATIPFQGIYFLIYTFQLENNGKLSKEMSDRLNLASALCQIVAYFSLGGVVILWYNMSSMVGITFSVSAVTAMILVRFIMKQPKEDIIV